MRKRIKFPEHLLRGAELRSRPAAYADTHADAGSANSNAGSTDANADAGSANANAGSANANGRSANADAGSANATTQVPPTPTPDAGATDYG